MGVTRRVAVCLLVVLASAVTLGMASAELVSHRAIYTMTLGSTTSKSDIHDLTGQMAFEIADGCDGWTLEQRIGLQITSLEGDEVRSYTSFTSWESKDGKRFRFSQETKQNGRTIEEISGRAELTDDGGGTAYLTKPDAIEIPLPPGTLFPSLHTEQLIARAMAGDRYFVRVVFDGSTLDNPNQVSAFIGAPTELAGVGDDAGPRTAWPVRLAFFSLKRQTPEPDVEIGMLLQADGIAREVSLDYGSFTIHGELDAIEILSPMAC